MKQKMTVEMTGCCGQQASTLHLSAAHLHSTAHGETRPCLVGWNTVRPALMDVSDSFSFYMMIDSCSQSWMTLICQFEFQLRQETPWIWQCSQCYFHATDFAFEFKVFPFCEHFDCCLGQGKVGHRRWWCSSSFRLSCFQQLMPALIKHLTCWTRLICAQIPLECYTAEWECINIILQL